MMDSVLTLGAAQGLFQNYRFWSFVAAGTMSLFVFAFGACVGSLINVLVYRLPLGLDVIRPASRCPACDTKLTWRENIPVLGWVFLRGRCRFCKSWISPEYPIVEALVGLLFLTVHLLWFVLPAHGSAWFGINGDFAEPEWAANGFAVVWPHYAQILVLLGCLFAMTIIDARTYQIPLVLTIVPIVLGVLTHAGHAAWVEFGSRAGRLRFTSPGEAWTIASPGRYGWMMVGAALGGTAGLVLSNVLLAVGVFRRSYADYDAWEAEALKEAGIDPEAESFEARVPVSAERGERVPWRRSWWFQSSAAIVVGGVIGAVVMSVTLDWPAAGGFAVGALVGLPVAGVVRRLAGKGSGPRASTEADEEAERWVMYPHARREAIKELVFVTPIVALALLGATVALRLAGPWTLNATLGVPTPAMEVPLWLAGLSASLFGLLVGGGVVWAVRIFGTLWFGKDAMGLGDVWLMAAVGASLGWIDALLGFLVAPMIAIYGIVVVWAWTSGIRRQLPFGPALAVASVLVLVGKPLVELGLTALWQTSEPVNLP